MITHCYFLCGVIIFLLLSIFKVCLCANVLFGSKFCLILLCLFMSKKFWDFDLLSQVYLVFHYLGINLIICSIKDTDFLGRLCLICGLAHLFLIDIFCNASWLVYLCTQLPICFSSIRILQCFVNNIYSMVDSHPNHNGSWVLFILHRLILGHYDWQWFLYDKCMCISIIYSLFISTHLLWIFYLVRCINMLCCTLQVVVFIHRHFSTHHPYRCWNILHYFVRFCVIIIH